MKNVKQRKGSTYAQRKRATFAYRTEYFKHNPGLFGQIWFCAYCHKPIIGKENVQVDHIVPLNCVLGRNARFNLVAACPKCNLAKSDKVDLRILTGYTSKGIEAILFTIQKLFIIVFAAVFWAANSLISGVIHLLTLPFRQKNLKVAIFSIICYACIIYYFVSQIS